MADMDGWNVCRTSVLTTGDIPWWDASVPGGGPLPEKAIAVNPGDVRLSGARLPKGFVTYPLLDKDFSDDEQVVEFVSEYGLVCCPYGQAMSRTKMEMEGAGVTARLLGRVRDEEEGAPGGLGLLRRGLVAVSRLVKGRNPESSFKGFEDQAQAYWQPMRIYYDGMNACDISSWAIEERRGFARCYDGDDMLPGTERLRALSCWAAQSGMGNYPICLVSFEEVRMTLYLLQLAAAVLQGCAAIEGTKSYRTRIGSLERSERSWLKSAPGYASPSEAECRRSNFEGYEKEALDALAREDRAKLAFDMFLRGRVNLLKALRAVGGSDYLDDGYRGLRPHEVLTCEEKRIVASAEARSRRLYADDSEALALLDMTPNYQGWEHLEEDLTLFAKACVSCGWEMGLGDGGAEFYSELCRDPSAVDIAVCLDASKGHMSLQRAIAIQLFEYVGEAGEDWKTCDWCGEPFYMVNRSSRLLDGNKSRKSARARVPESPVCSGAHRKRLEREGD